MANCFLAGLVVCFLSTAAQAQGETPQPLKGLIENCGCPLADIPANVLNMNVQNSSAVIDAQGFVLAFKSSLESGGGTPLYLFTGTKNDWKLAEFPTRGVGKGGKDLNGPIANVQLNEGMILISVSVSFSDTATVIVGPDLQQRGLVHGVVTAVLPNGVVIYQRNQDRFAATHYVELAALDTRSGMERDIYPPTPADEIRLEHIEQVSQDYAAKGPQWCQQNKHHCNPALFETRLWMASQGKSYVYDPSTATLAFSVIYAEASNAVDVMVVCTGMDRLDAIECHETSFEEWANAHNISGDDHLVVLGRAAAGPTQVRP